MKSVGKFIRIFCEGKVTEPNYFIGLIKVLELNNARISKPRDHSPLGIVKAAKEEYKKARKAKIPDRDIEIWAVFDRDGHPKIPEALNMALDNGINVAFSNTCFEYWILLHFEKATKPFGPCDEILKYIRDKYDPDYSKNNDHYFRLADKIETAIENNKWLLKKHWEHEIEENEIKLELNPFTNVYKLIEFLKENKNDL